MVTKPSLLPWRLLGALECTHRSQPVAELGLMRRGDRQRAHDNTSTAYRQHDVVRRPQFGCPRDQRLLGCLTLVDGLQNSLPLIASRPSVQLQLSSNGGGSRGGGQGAGVALGPAQGPPAASSETPRSDRCPPSPTGLHRSLLCHLRHGAAQPGGAVPGPEHVDVRGPEVPGHAGGEPPGSLTER